MTRIVVIGAGQAGATLVEKLRAGGHDGPLTLIGDEPHLPYQRPPLSKKYLLGEFDAERLHLRPQSFYDDADIDVRTDQCVTSIDPEAQSVTLADGEVLAFDKLALTTGSVPRRLPDDMGGGLAGVFTVRTVADVDAMAQHFSEGARVLIVGGGYIGLEAAAVAAQKGLNVTLIEAADRILSRVAAPETADFFRALHAAHGVDIREGVGLGRLTGDDAANGAVLSDGSTLALDFAIIGIGIAPATDLAAAAGLAIDNGIRVDAQGRTSAPNIFAAGDCTSFPYGGDHIRLESVPHAIHQAEIVAGVMLGGDETYAAKPWFWSDQYDVKLQIAGLSTGYDRTVVRPGARDGTQSVWYFAGTHLLAVDAMSDAKAYLQGKRWIEGGVSPAPDDVADPELDLKTMQVG